MKAAIRTPKHTRAIEEVTGLPGELEKKLDKAGGTMTGDLHVEGDTHARNLRVDEYLEVPELKYNRITATGNEFWVTDGGTVDDVAEGDDGIYLVTFKSDEDETAISFQFKDILRSIFYTENGEGNPAGVRTAFFEVTGVIDQTLLLHSSEQYSITTLYDSRASGQQVGCAPARLSLYVFSYSQIFIPDYPVFTPGVYNNFSPIFPEFSIPDTRRSRR